MYLFAVVLWDFAGISGVSPPLPALESTSAPGPGARPGAPGAGTWARRPRDPGYGFGARSARCPDPARRVSGTSARPARLQRAPGARLASARAQQHPLHSKHHPDTSRARDLGPTSPNIPGPATVSQCHDAQPSKTPLIPSKQHPLHLRKHPLHAQNAGTSALGRALTPGAGCRIVCVCVLFLLWLARAARDSSANCSARNGAMCLSHACTPMRSTCLRRCSHPRAPCAFHVGRRVYVCVLM